VPRCNDFGQELTSGVGFVTVASATTGGCQCGSVRYRIVGPITNVHLCHCRMCQKAVGNAFATIGVAKKSNVEHVRNAPAWFRSSMHVRRGFCDACGTPLFYADDTSDTLGIMIGTLDRPADFPPERQDGIEGRLGWVLSLSEMPEKGATGAGNEAKWAEAIAQSIRQHPDFEI
jgi:hypothetical protein